MALCAASDYEQIEAALDKCERILDEFLNQILEDKRMKRLWLAFSLEDVEADYVVNSDNQLYGVIAVIPLSEPYKSINCRKAFLLDRTFDETFDKTYK